jgi:hypothetical protein
MFIVYCTEHSPKRAVKYQLLPETLREMRNPWEKHSTFYFKRARIAVLKYRFRRAGPDILFMANLFHPIPPGNFNRSIKNWVR